MEVTFAEREGGKYVLRGLRDPEAVAPDTLLQAYGLDKQEVDQWWTPFRSLDVPIVMRKLQRHISVPETVDMEFQDRTLHLQGSASLPWLRTFEGLVTRLELADSVDASRLALLPTGPAVPR